MEIIKKNNFTFFVDVEKTKEYYLTNSICNCYGCRNLCEQIKTLSPQLTEFLSEFGIDICRPDETADFEKDNHIDYSFIGYTAVGDIETDGIYETDIGNFHIKISDGSTPQDWFPNEQKESHFFISVSGVSLPRISDETLPHKERFTDKIKSFFSKK